MLIFWRKCPKYPKAKSPSKPSSPSLSSSRLSKHPLPTDSTQTSDKPQEHSQSDTFSSSNHTTSNNTININTLNEQFNLKLKHLLLNPLNPSISKNHEIIISLIDMYITQPDILNCIISFVLSNFVQILTLNNETTFVILKIYETFELDSQNTNVINSILAKHLVFLLSFKKGCDLLIALIRKGNIPIINECAYAIEQNFIYCANNSYSADVIEELLIMKYQPIMEVLIRKIVECMKDIFLTEYGRRIILKAIQLTNNKTKEMIYMKLQEFSLIENNYFNM